MVRLSVRRATWTASLRSTLELGRSQWTEPCTLHQRMPAWWLMTFNGKLVVRRGPKRRHFVSREGRTEPRVASVRIYRWRSSPYDGFVCFWLNSFYTRVAKTVFKLSPTILAFKYMLPAFKLQFWSWTDCETYETLQIETFWLSLQQVNNRYLRETTWKRKRHCRGRTLFMELRLIAFKFTIGCRSRYAGISHRSLNSRCAEVGAECMVITDGR